MHRLDRRTAAGIALIFAITLLAYIPAMKAGFVWDDDDYVTQNQRLKSIDGLRQIWTSPTAGQYYPLVHTSFWLDYHLWRLNPQGYHLVNIILHCISAAVLWMILSRLRIPGAWLAAAIFALHPVQVDSVAWVTERKNTLACVLGLFSTLTYLRFAGIEAAPARRSWAMYGLCFALFLLAMLSKTAIVGLPCALAVVLWWKRNRLRLADILPLAAMAVVGTGLALLTVYVEKHESGATGEEFSFGVPERLVIAGRAFWFYLGNIGWPVHLCPVYPRWALNPSLRWQYLYPSAAIGLVFALWQSRSRIGKGPLTALLVFIVMLVPALGLVNFYFMRYSFVADHFQYFASIGPIVLAGFAAEMIMNAIARASSRAEGGRAVPAHKFAAVGYVLILGTLGTLTWRQAKIYRNLETISRETIARNPSAHLALVNLAVIHADRGELEKAKPLAARALQAYPAIPEAHHILGLALMAERRLDEAAAEFQRALELNPKAPEPQVGLGRIYMARGQLDEAIACFRKSIDPWDLYAPGHAALGVALAARGDSEAAAEHLQKALSLQPRNPDAHEAFALLRLRQGKLPEAVQHAEAALQAGPGHPRALYVLGLALAQQGQWDKSTAALRKALAAAPHESDIQNRLALNLLQTGKIDEAIQLLTQAVQDKPENVETQCNLALLLVRKGDPEAAIARLQAFTTAMPRAAAAHKFLGDILVSRKRPAPAVAAYRAALAAQPQFAPAANELAWLLATHPDGNLRNGAEAVRWAEMAAKGTGYNEWSVLDTLAAAYAEAGRMTDAVSAAQTALTLAPQGSQQAQELEARLKLYQAGKPYRAAQ